MAPEPNFRVTEIKAFVPAKDFALSKRFYQDIGFTMASEGGGVAYFRCGSASFLLQDFWVDGCADEATGRCDPVETVAQQRNYGQW